jgi:dihydrofolate reductase
VSRRLRYNFAASLDGFIADPTGGYDWIVEDASIDFQSLFSEFDTLVMGRKTWEVTQSTEFVPMLDGKQIVVFSRGAAPANAAGPGVTLTSRDPVATVRDLKAAPGKDIWMFGGGELCRVLADAGLLDTVEVALMPVLLCEGIPLIAPGRRFEGLSLLACERLPSGIVMLRYAMPEAGAAAG